MPDSPTTYHQILLSGDELKALIEALEKAEGDANEALETTYTPLGLGKYKLSMALTSPTIVMKEPEGS